MPSINLGRAVIVPKGEYSGSSTYEYLDVVSYQGCTYLYINQTPSSNKLPTLATHWMLLASRGDIPVALEDLERRWSTATADVIPTPVGSEPSVEITQDTATGTNFSFSIPDGKFYFATFGVDIETGQLIMTIPQGYQGADFQINPVTGMLEAVLNG